MKSHRRNTRHTTHLDGFPSKVCIIRERHPLQGQMLEVLGWTHRNESLHLTLVLPDGTRSLIPADWTDLDITKTQNRQSTNRRLTKSVLASICHLLHARKIVDALLCRMDASTHVHTNASKEESKRVSTNRSLARSAPIATNPRHLAKPRSTRADKAHRSLGQADQQSRLSRSSQPNSGEKP